MANSNNKLSNSSRAAASETAPLEKMPARVHKVHVEGVCRTKDDVIISTVKQLFASTTFADMVQKAGSVQRQLESLDAFKTVRIFIDTSPQKGSSKAKKDNYEVTFFVTEKRRLEGGVHTYLGNNSDGSVVLQTRLPNIAGRGESVQLEYQYGTKRTAGLNLSLVKPLRPWSPYTPRILASLFQHGTDHPWAGFREVDRGSNLSLLLKYGPAVNHKISYEGVWRDLAPLSAKTAFGVREYSGHSLKSSVKHDLTFNGVIGDIGSLLKLEQEFAGLGGDVAFQKHEAELQLTVPLTHELTFEANLRGGLMKPGDPKVGTNIADRFFLGGPLNLRGFQLFGVGPHTEGCALGASCYWTAGLHLYAPLPFVSKGGPDSVSSKIRSHFFLNAGNIGSLAWTGDYLKDAHLHSILCRSGIRYSIGVGLVAQLGVARFELHYAVPFRAQIGDRLEPGLQFGVGVNYV